MIVFGDWEELLKGVWSASAGGGCLERVSGGAQRAEEYAAG